MANKEVDLTGANQECVWLVKIPSYLSQQLQKAEGDEVGKIQINRRNQREVTFWLKKQLAFVPGQEDNMVAVPRKHSFTLQPVEGQMLGVFSENSSDEIACLGKVQLRAECTPAYLDEYLRLKRLEIKTKPNLARMLETQSPVANYKPVSKHPYHRAIEKKRREGLQKTKVDKQLVMDMLFRAFEKHQYYNIKYLVDLTKQPVIYLKKILNEIGMYNVKGTHKYTWELKPEYRHYGGKKK